MRRVRYGCIDGGSRGSSCHAAQRTVRHVRTDKLKGGTLRFTLSPTRCDPTKPTKRPQERVVTASVIFVRPLSLAKSIVHKKKCKITVLSPCATAKAQRRRAPQRRTFGTAQLAQSNRSVGCGLIKVKRRTESIQKLPLDSRGC